MIYIGISPYRLLKKIEFYTKFTISKFVSFIASSFLVQNNTALGGKCEVLHKSSSVYCVFVAPKILHPKEMIIL